MPPLRPASAADPAEARAFLDARPETAWIEVFVTDLCGVARGKRLRRHELAALYRGGRPLPGSLLGLDITGRDVEEAGLLWETGDADLLCWPLPGRLQPKPWGGPDQAQVLGSLHGRDGGPADGDPRQVLARVLERFRPLGLTPVVAVELEFYLFEAASAAAGRPQPPGGLPEDPQPCHLADLDCLEPFLADLYAGAEAMGLPLGALLSEAGPGQLEAVLLHRDDALRAADEAVLYKRLVKGTARRHGLVASFMAKPYAELPGNGMHLHLSLADAAGRNAFAFDGAAPPPLLLQALGGLKACMPASVALLAPNANSYRRFALRSYAPASADWGLDNRSLALRVTAGPAESRHIEHRLAGADANPYLGLAALLAGALHGIGTELDPGPPVEGDGYRLAAGRPLPNDWAAALRALRADEVLAGFLGARSLEIFLAIKQTERERFEAVPTERDLAWYLRDA